MNPRIQKLYTQALENKFDYGGGEGVKPGEYYSNYKTVLNVEKFAELIVLETINCAAHIEGIEAIKQHFGIDNN